MNKFWSKRLNAVAPYVPGEQPKDRKYIKLNTNENPYPPCPAALDVVVSESNAELKLYPDPECAKLREALADYYNLSPNNVFVGNGSDEVLAFCFPAFFDPGCEIVFADITYSFYPVYANLFGVNFRLIPLNDDLTMPVEKFCEPSDGVLIVNPNAPTSIALPLEDVEKIISANSNCVVIVDEAYVDFGAQSAVPLIEKYDNLLVVQTFSKSRSLAGLRVGYALGNENLIRALDSVKNSINSYTLDRVAISAAAAAVDLKGYYEDICNKIIMTRTWVTSELRKIGFDVPDSKGNFVFAAHKEKPAKEIFEELRKRGILVRYFNAPRIDNRLRITIGTDNEMEALVFALTKILG